MYISIEFFKCSSSIFKYKVKCSKFSDMRTLSSRIVKRNKKVSKQKNPEFT